MQYRNVNLVRPQFANLSGGEIGFLLDFQETDGGYLLWIANGEAISGSGS
jgi:hypothetical protein